MRDRTIWVEIWFVQHKPFFLKVFGLMFSFRNSFSELVLKALLVLIFIQNPHKPLLASIEASDLANTLQAVDLPPFELSSSSSCAGGKTRESMSHGLQLTSGI